jgi:hypothetical protein
MSVWTPKNEAALQRAHKRLMNARTPGGRWHWQRIVERLERARRAA